VDNCSSIYCKIIGETNRTADLGNGVNYCRTLQLRLPKNWLGLFSLLEKKQGAIQSFLKQIKIKFEQLKSEETSAVENKHDEWIWLYPEECLVSAREDHYITLMHEFLDEMSDRFFSEYETGYRMNIASVWKSSTKLNYWQGLIHFQFFELNKTQLMVIDYPEWVLDKFSEEREFFEEVDDQSILYQEAETLYKNIREFKAESENKKISQLIQQHDNETKLRLSEFSVEDDTVPF
jgi:hypothetical protein